MDVLLHIRVSKKLRDKLQLLVDSGLYNNQAEVVREAIRNLLKEETIRNLVKQKDEDKNKKDGKG